MFFSRQTLLPIIIVSGGFLFSAAISQAAAAPNNSHQQTLHLGDIRLGANMDLTAESRNFGIKQNRQIIDLREVEVSLESQIKPWLFGSIFLTRPSGESMSIEEASVIADLPNQWQLKAGMYRNEFGLINIIHEPERPQASLPLPITEFLGDEQLRESSITVGRLIEHSNGYRSGISAAVFNSDNDVAFDAGQSGNKAFAAKLYFGQQSDKMAYQLGLSAVTGKNDSGGTTDIQALDFRFMYKPNFARGYDYSARFSWIGELLFNQRELASGATNQATGYWTVADYQFMPAHHLGVGAEYTQGRLDKTVTSQAYSAHYSWYYSPHARLQLQARHVDITGGDKGLVILLQWNIILGAHSERPFLVILPVDERE